MEAPDSNMVPQIGGTSTFPTNPEDFDSDDRISFSQLDNKFLLVHENGTEYEFNEGKNGAEGRWIAVLDEELMEQQQRAYAVQGVDENEPVDAMRRKRKKEYVNGEDVSYIISYVFRHNHCYSTSWKIVSYDYFYIHTSINLMN